MDIPDDLDYNPSKYQTRKDCPQDLEENACGSIAYTRYNAGLTVYLKGAKQARQFQYVHLQDDGPDDGFAADGTLFSVLFAGYHVQRLTVRGRNLKKFYDALVSHRLCTLRAADRPQFEVGKEPVVESIVIATVESPESPDHA